MKNKIKNKILDIKWDWDYIFVVHRKVHKGNEE